MTEVEVKVSAGRTLMVLVDGSDNSKKAFDAVLAWKRPQDKLYVVHAVEVVASIPVGVGPAVAFVDPGVLESANESLKKRGAAIVKDYANKCEELKVPNVITSVLTTQNPKESVVKYAKDKAIETIFVGTRGLGAVKRFFLGSFSNYIVNHADCDVMVVKHDPETHEAAK